MVKAVAVTVVVQAKTKAEGECINGLKSRENLLLGDCLEIYAGIIKKDYFPSYSCHL